MPLYAEMETTKGVLVFEMLESKAPLTVKNFISLATKGFYDNLIFFKYIRGVLIQGGCPRNDGTGDAGYFIDCEIMPDNLHDNGSISMAKTRHNRVSSQFFIVLDRNEGRQFDGNYAPFGLLVKGKEVLLALREGDKILKITFRYEEESLK